MNILPRDEVFSALHDELLDMKKNDAVKRMTEDALFKEDLGLDSLDIVEFVARAEARYRVHVPDDDFSSLDTVGKVIDYVQARMLDRRA